VTTTRATPTTIPAEEAADRLAIRELFDAYAHCADRRDAKGQMALFTPDTRFLVYMDSRSEQPTQELHGRESLAPVFDNLNTYQVLRPNKLLVTKSALEKLEARLKD